MKYLKYIDLSYHDGLGDIKGDKKFTQYGKQKTCVDWKNCKEAFERCTFTPIHLCSDYLTLTTIAPTTSAPTFYNDLSNPEDVI